jgi:hypothetical protein
VQRFIHAVETLPDFVVISNLGLTDGGDNNEGLQLSLTVATYFRATRDVR